MLPFNMTHVPNLQIFLSSASLRPVALIPATVMTGVCQTLCQEHCFLFLPLTDIFWVISISSPIMALPFTVCTAGSACLLSCLQQLAQLTPDLSHSPFRSCTGQAQTHIPAVGFRVSQSLHYLGNELQIAFSPAPLSPRRDLPTTSPLCHFRSFSIHFHLSDREVAVDSLWTAQVRKRTQKKSEKNVATDAASHLCRVVPCAAVSVQLCHPRETGTLRETPLDSRSMVSWWLTKCSAPKHGRTPAEIEGLG